MLAAEIGRKGAGVTSPSTAAPTLLSLDDFAGLDDVACRALLHSCLDVDSWVEALTNGRPYASIEDLLATSVQVGSLITASEVLGALERHPRIGARLAGGSRESSWSSSEQSRVLQDADAAAQLATANAVYEAHFGFIFLVCAAGRSAQDLLGVLHERLSNDPDAEIDVVRGELLAIAGGRLQSAIAP
jgi:2-oxo-4-hydroxy-4-carboxy-5-ureidoimidazoline decarboxylase